MDTYQNFIRNKGKICAILSEIQDLIEPFCEAQEKTKRLFNYARNEFFFQEILINIDSERTSYADLHKQSYGSFFFGNPVTNNSYPWPVTENGEGLIPLAQICLLVLAVDNAKYISDVTLKAWLKNNFQAGKDRKVYLQAWSERLNIREGDRTVTRLVPDFQPNFSTKSIPKKITGEMTPEEYPDWFGKTGLGVRFVIRNRHDEKTIVRPCLELFNLQGEPIALLGSGIDYDKIPEDCMKARDKLEDRLAELIDDDDVPNEILFHEAHFFGGCYSDDCGETTLELLEYGGWRLFLQMPKEFDYWSKPDKKGEQRSCYFPYWGNMAPAIYYRFVDGQDEPEFIVR